MSFNGAVSPICELSQSFQGNTNCRPALREHAEDTLNKAGRPPTGIVLRNRFVEIVNERWSGLDVHKKTVAACVTRPERRETRTFGTVTKELLALRDWLVESGVTHVNFG